MNGVAKRLYVVAAIVVAVYAVSRLVQAEADPPDVEMPNWTFRELPLQLGDWHGEDFQMDPKIAVATGAEVIVDRIYRDEQKHTISLHTAMFSNPADGVLHSPLNCYPGNGWTKLSETRDNVQVSGESTIAVSLTTWEKEGDQLMVVYWYQLGNQVLYSRFDLGSIRVKMWDQPKWPALVKVMVQIPIAEPEDTKSIILGFSEQVAQWLNQPEHQKYLRRWPKI